MNTSKRRSRYLTTLGVLVVMCVAAGLSGCSSTVKLKYVNWDVEFNKGISEVDKAVAMDSIRRYILQTLSTRKDTFLYLRQVSISYDNFKNHDRAIIGVFLRISEAGQTGVAPPPPKGGPGRYLEVYPRPAIPSVQNAQIKLNVE
jgi:hypothetical protein